MALIISKTTRSSRDSILGLMIPIISFWVAACNDAYTQSFSEVNKYVDNPSVVINRKLELMFMPLGSIESNRTFIDKDVGESRMQGSAFLISPCYIITNHHVVYGNELPPDPDLDYTMKFLAGYSPDATFLGDTMATPVVSGERRIDGHADWTLLRLRECIGGPPWSFGWFECAAAPSSRLVGLRVGVAGYSKDLPVGSLGMGIGEVTGVSFQNDLVAYSAPTSKGQSGGPVFATVGGRLKVVGVNTRQRITLADKGNSTFRTYSLEKANEFVNIYDVVNDARVKELIKLDRLGIDNAHLTRLMPPAAFEKH